MSGHSKWSTIKHKKGLNDAKKGKVFSKFSKLITVAAREGGPDVNMNPNLRLLVNKAKSESMPVANIDRAIERGSGKNGEGITFESPSYDGFGPEGVSLIIDVLTENKNRAVAEIRNIFTEHGFNLGDSGSVSWNFDVKGLVSVRCAKPKKAEKYGAPDEIEEFDKDEVTLELMEIDGILDIQDAEIDGGVGLELFTSREALGKVRDLVMEKGYIVSAAEIVKTPKMTKKFTPEQMEKIGNFIEKLEDYDDVQNVWTDIDPLSL